MSLEFTITKTGITFFVKVTPRSGKRVVAGIESGKLKIKLLSPPEKGEANAELIEFLSERLSIKKADIKVVSGEASRIKKIGIDVDSDKAAELARKIGLL